MIGTGYDLLYYLTFNPLFPTKTLSSRKDILQLRRRLARHDVREETIEMYLTAMGCKLMRAPITIPAVYKDTHGKLYDECTMIRAAELWKTDVELGPSIHAIVTGHMPDPLVVKRFAKHKRWSKFQDRTYLPSVWKYEDPDLWTDRDYYRFGGLIDTSRR